MANIFEINQRKIFSIEEANQILPLVLRLTKEAVEQTQNSVRCLESLSDKKGPRAKELENEINSLVERWQLKIEKLGLFPKGLWLADFDNGQGYFCWKYPEKMVNHYHGYQDGFSGRRKLNEPFSEMDQSI